MTKTKRLVVLMMALVLAVPALAQETGVTGTDTSTSATLAELRSEAQRLTALAQVPEAGRDAAGALLDRLTTLTESARQQEIARLQAYIAALRSGDSPAVAQEVAASAVSLASVELAREREALSADVQAFIETYPEAASVFRRTVLSGNQVAILGSVRDGSSQRLAVGNGRIIQVRPGSGTSLGNAFGATFGSDRGRAGRPLGSFHLTAPFGAEPSVPEVPDAGEESAP